MSMMLMVKAMQMKVGNPLRKLVLLKLADNANDKGECWPSYQHIADQCEISRDTAIRHINALAKQGFLKIEKRKVSGTMINHSNIYHLTLGGGTEQPPSSTEQKGSGTNRLGSSTEQLGGSSTERPRTSHSFEPVNEPKQSSIDDGKSSSQQTDNKEKSEIPETQQYQKKPTNGYSEAFEAWWSIYPKKIGKGDAWKSWKSDKLDKKADQLIEKLEAQNAMQYSFTEYKFIPLPATYLNQSRYDDEVQLATNGGINETNSGRKLSAVERVRIANEKARAERATQNTGA